MFKKSRNNLSVGNNTAPKPLLRDDGTNFPFRMFYDHNERIVDADSLAELIEQLIPGYLQLSTEEEKLAQRIEFINGVAFSLRVNILANLRKEDMKNSEQWEMDVLMADGPLTESYPEHNPKWNTSAPLVIVSTDYTAPDSRVAPSSGLGEDSPFTNIIELDAATEESFLNSLGRVGYLTYGSPIVE